MVAQATFQRTIDNLLAGIKGKFAYGYIDDIVIYSSTWDEHLQHLNTLFQRLYSAGMKMNSQKCHFGLREIKFFGHIIGDGVIKKDPAKMAGVRDC